MNQIRTPLDMLFLRERTSPQERVFFQSTGRFWLKYTWEEIGEEVRTMATYLEQRGFPKGSRIAILARNSVHWLMADWAIWLAGYVSVPVFVNTLPTTLGKIFQDADVRLVFVGSVYNWQDCLQGIPPETQIISLPHGGPRGYPAWGTVKAPCLPKGSYRLPKPEELATIIYTSGTTGEPRGVMHSFASLAFAGSNVVAETKITPKDRLFSYLPLSHVAERLLIEMSTLYGGASVFMGSRADRLQRELRYARPTIFLGVPRIWSSIYELLHIDGTPKLLVRLAQTPILGLVVRYFLLSFMGLQRVRIFLSGAAPLQVSLQKWFRGIGVLIQEAYGLTENFAYSHFTRRAETERYGVGTPLPGVEVKLSDDGEILMRSPTLMMGYYSESGPIKDGIDSDGWLQTGDLGAIDSETQVLKITGRKKDLFKTSRGKYVAPLPIEERLVGTNLFEQVCVLGNGKPFPIAIVRMRDSARRGGHLALRRDLERVRGLVNKNLEHDQQLEKIAVVDEDWTIENGVLTPTLKIKRSIVEARFEKSLSLWSRSDDSVVFANNQL